VMEMVFADFKLMSGGKWPQQGPQQRS